MGLKVITILRAGSRRSGRANALGRKTVVACRASVEEGPVHCRRTRRRTMRVNETETTFPAQ